VHGQCVDGCRCHAQRATRYATAAEWTQKIDICAVARECVPDGSGPDVRHLLSKIVFFIFFASIICFILVVTLQKNNAITRTRDPTVTHARTE
jgi:hypothetical protein